MWLLYGSKPRYGQTQVSINLNWQFVCIILRMYYLRIINSLRWCISCFFICRQVRIQKGRTRCTPPYFSMNNNFCLLYISPLWLCAFGARFRLHRPLVHAALFQNPGSASGRLCEMCVWLFLELQNVFDFNGSVRVQVIFYQISYFYNFLKIWSVVCQ